MVDTKDLPIHVKFMLPALSGVGAAMISFPLDLLKTQMQIIGKGTRDAHITTYQLASRILKTEGYIGFYSGLSAGIVRQISYTGIRMGSFQVLLDYFSEEGKTLNVFNKCIYGAVTGAAGGIAGLPSDVAQTRMAAPPGSRRDYKNVFDAFARMIKEEGIRELFRGFSPTVIRAAVINVCQIIGYTHAKSVLMKYNITNDSIYCHTASGMYSGLIAAIVILPVDITKTRMQDMRIINGKPEYNSMLDASFKIVTKEGFISLWKGFTPQFLRNGTLFTVFYIIYENLLQLHKKYTAKSKNT